MDSGELFYSNLESIQPAAGWRADKTTKLHTDQQYTGVTNISVTLETALLLSIAIIGAIMLLAINLVGPVFCKRCFRRGAGDLMERGQIFQLASLHDSGDADSTAEILECTSDSEDPPLIMENKHAHFETVTYIQDAADVAQEVT